MVGDINIVSSNLGVIFDKCMKLDYHISSVCKSTYFHLRNIGGTGQVGLGVGSWPSNRATEGSNPKGTRLYFVILLKNVEKIFNWH